MFCDMSMVELANAHNCDTSININNYNPHKYAPGKVFLNKISRKFTVDVG